MPDNPNLRSKLARALETKRKDDDSYPRHDIDYYDRFARLDSHLNEHVHPSVNQGATAADHTRATWLTDHGSKHIETVIRRASDLAFAPDLVLSPYEVYLLLIAIHFHDVGNIFGREGHERRISEVMTTLDSSMIGDSTLEQRLICKIATAHGGYVDVAQNPHDKNTIEPLRCLSQNKRVRAALLAGILRFADELAEDKTRTERFLVDRKLITPESEVYHHYALCLDPIQVDAAEHSVDMHFDLTVDLVTRTLQKGTSQVYLVDAIIERTLKMHHEHVYCGRFMEPNIHIAQINVTVDICTNDYHTVVRQIQYSMAAYDYPAFPLQLSDICPALTDVTGTQIHEEMAQAVGQGKD